MADWYAGTVQYAAVTQWSAAQAVSIGALRRQLATPTVGNERVFRCTTAGTTGGSEPSWTLTKGGTTNDNTAVWTEVTGNSSYGWSAAAARLTLFANLGWAAAGDTIYVANDYAETRTFISNNWPGTSASPNRVLCVDPAGSVPPVSADLSTGATATGTASSNSITGSVYTYGVSYITTAAFNTSIGGGDNRMTFERCAFRQTNASAQDLIVGSSSTDQSNVTTLKNTTVEFGHSGSGIRMVGGKFEWLNTASAVVSGTLPTNLFLGTTTNGISSIVLDGVDLSALGSGKTIIAANGGTNTTSIRNCKLGGSVTVAATPALPPNRVTLEISDSGATGYRQEIYDYAGTLTTETTIVETGGASDGVQAISWKVVTTANAKQSQPFATFQIAQWNTATGSAKTATIEIVNDGTTLKNTEVWVEVEYLGSSSYPLASVVSSGADVLSAGSNISTSNITWTTTGLSSPTKQYLQVSFTPQMVGYVRATVYVGKASQTLYIDPKMTIA